MKRDIFVWSRKFKDVFILDNWLRDDIFKCIRLRYYFDKSLSYTSIFGIELSDLEDYHFGTIMANSLNEINLNDVAFPRTKNSGNIIPRYVYITNINIWIRPFSVDRSYRDVVKVTFQYKDELKFISEYFPRNESWR